MKLYLPNGNVLEGSVEEMTVYQKLVKNPPKFTRVHGKRLICVECHDGYIGAPGRKFCSRSCASKHNKPWLKSPKYKK